MIQAGAGASKKYAGRSHALPDPSCIWRLGIAEEAANGFLRMLGAHPYAALRYLRIIYGANTILAWPAPATGHRSG